MEVAEPDDADQIEYETDEEDAEVLKVQEENEMLHEAQQLVAVEKENTKEVVSEAENLRIKMNETRHNLQIEISRRQELERDKLRNYEVNYASRKTEPLKLTRMRTQVEKLEVEQDRQKAFLDNIVFKNDSIQEFFLEAVQQQDLEKCKSLLQCGANVNQLLKQNQLPIHSAVKAENLELCRLLLEFGADYSSYLSGYPAMVLAAAERRPDIIRLLSDFGAQVGEKASDGTSALLAAVNSGCTDCEQLLLSMGADHPMESDEDGHPQTAAWLD
eukprot:gene32837-42515_t